MPPPGGQGPCARAPQGASPLILAGEGSEVPRNIDGHVAPGGTRELRAGIL